LYQKYNAKKREKKNIFFYGNLLWGVALGRQCCSGEKIYSGELLWGVALGRQCCFGEAMLLWGEICSGELLWGEICSGELLWGGNVALGSCFGE